MSRVTKNNFLNSRFTENKIIYKTKLNDTTKRKKVKIIFISHMLQVGFVPCEQDDAKEQEPGYCFDLILGQNYFSSN